MSTPKMEYTDIPSNPEDGLDIGESAYIELYCMECKKVIARSKKPMQLGDMVKAKDFKPTEFALGKWKSGEEIKCKNCGSPFIYYRKVGKT